MFELYTRKGRLNMLDNNMKRHGAASATAMTFWRNLPTSCTSVIEKVADFVAAPTLHAMSFTGCNNKEMESGQELHERHAKVY